MLEAQHACKAPCAAVSFIGRCTITGKHTTRDDEEARNNREANELLCKWEDEARAM